MNGLSEVKHLLVDLDGTLLGAWDLPVQIRFIRKTLRRLHKRAGLITSVRTLKAVKKELENPTSEQSNQKRANDIIARGFDLTLEEAEKVMDELMGSVFPSLKRFMFPIKGAKEFLDWARKIYPITLATNPIWKREIIEMRVRWAGIDPAIFKNITDATKMVSCKPSARYYEDLLKLEGLKPQEALLIGNEFKMDLPAVRVGIPVHIIKKSKKLQTLTYPESKALAWTGNFSALQEHLSQKTIASGR